MIEIYYTHYLMVLLGTILGVVLTLSYQKIRAWWTKPWFHHNGG